MVEPTCSWNLQRKVLEEAGRVRSKSWRTVDSPLKHGSAFFLNKILIKPKLTFLLNTYYAPGLVAGLGLFILFHALSKPRREVFLFISFTDEKTEAQEVERLMFKDYRGKS